MNFLKFKLNHVNRKNRETKRKPHPHCILTSLTSSSSQWWNNYKNHFFLGKKKVITKLDWTGSVAFPFYTSDRFLWQFSLSLFSLFFVLFIFEVKHIYGKYHLPPDNTYICLSQSLIFCIFVQIENCNSCLCMCGCTYGRMGISWYAFLWPVR